MITREAFYKSNEPYQFKEAAQENTLRLLYNDIGEAINNGKTYTVSIISSETSNTESDMTEFQAIADIRECQEHEVDIYNILPINKKQGFFKRLKIGLKYIFTGRN